MRLANVICFFGEETSNWIECIGDLTYSHCA